MIDMQVPKHHVCLFCTIILFILYLTSSRSLINSTVHDIVVGELHYGDKHIPPASRRRRLSNTNNNNCNAPPKFDTKGELPPTYFATYPGSGSRVTRQLIKALTGLRVQNEYDEQSHEDTVAIQTKFPHGSGSLVAWDRNIHRAVVLLRNPIYALPSLFDELYSTKKHLPVKFHPRQDPNYRNDDLTANVAEWISWRDRMFESQFISYTEFIRYWIKRYGHQDRLIIAYEDVTNGDGTGIEEAKRIVDFFGNMSEHHCKKRKCEVVQVPTVELNDIPCVWQTVVQHVKSDVEEEEKEENAQRRASVGKEHRRLDSYLIPHPSSIEDAPATRLFTSEQLNVMATVLAQISAEVDTQSHHLNQILNRYQNEIIDVLKMQKDDTTEDELTVAQSPGNQFHVFSVAPPGSQSPIITNWLIGLFEPDTEYTHLITNPGLSVYQHEKEVPITTTIVTQTNEINMIGLYEIYKPGFQEVLFVFSKTGTDADKEINDGVCEYENVLCIDDVNYYEEYLNSGSKEFRGMVRSLTDKLEHKFGHLLGPLIQMEGAISRLQEMKTTVYALKDEPFEVVDTKFGVHGGLRQAPTTTDGQIVTNNDPPRRLFYCGSTGSGDSRSWGNMGIYLANAFFPEIVGTVPESGGTGAIQLTSSSIIEATQNDFLVFMMHQYCEVDVLEFPGMQLHVNVSFCSLT